MTKTNEAFWWSLFSAGGVMSAMFIPVFVVITGFILPFTWGDDPVSNRTDLKQAVFFWPVRIVLFGVIFLCFFHCAHRIKHVLHDVGIHFDFLLMILCYGGALAGSVSAFFILII